MSLQEDAYSIVSTIQKTSDPRQRREFVMRFAWVYEALTGKSLKGVPEGQDEDEILDLLRKLANGEVSLPGEDGEQASNIPTDLDDLLQSYQRAMEKGSIVDRQVIKAVIEAWIKKQKGGRLARILEEAGVEKQKSLGTAKEIISSLEKTEGQKTDEEVIKRALGQIAEKEGVDFTEETKALLYQVYDSGLLPQNQVEKLGVLPRRRPSVFPSEKTSAQKPEPQQREKPGEIKKLELLIRLSYKKSSVVNEIANELARIPLGIPRALETTDVFLQSGVGPEILREGIDNFRKQNPDIDSGHPILKALASQLDDLQKLVSSQGELTETLEKHKDDIQINISLLEEGRESHSDAPTQRHLRFEVYQPKKGDFVLRQVAQPATKGASLKAVGEEALKTAQKTFFSELAKLAAKPLSLLAGVRAYLGGALVAGALILPLPAPLRVGIAALGFALGWKKIKTFFGDFIPQILSALKRVELLKFFSKTLGDILYTVFTKPALGWLRNALAVGFGAGALLLSVPIPLKILFLGIGGVFGTVQIGSSGSSFLLRGLGVVGRAGVRLSYALTALPGIPGALILGAILLAVLLPGFLAYQSAQTQALFLPQGGVTDQSANIQSPYFSVEKRIDPSVLKNEELPKTVNITITITAKDEPITLISAKEEFSVSGSSGSINSQTFNLSKNNLPPGESTELKISVNLDSGFKNSAVTSITKVEAAVDLEKGKTRTAAVSVSAIIIGSPPTFCFAFGGGWPESDRSLVVGAISHVSRAQVFVSKLCSLGSVRLLRHLTDPGWAGEVTGGNTINLYNPALTSSAQILYVLTHEMGHVYGNRYPGDLSRFRIDGKPIEEGYFPTYPERLGSQLSLDKRISEDFAETIAIYTIWRVVPYLGQYHLPDLVKEKPAHYNFAKTYIFGGFEF